MSAPGGSGVGSSSNSSSAGGIPLVVKCTSTDGRTKRLHFSSASSASLYIQARRRIARSLQLYDDWAADGSNSVPIEGKAVFDLSYTDDDGEVCHVASQADWQDALQFFCPSYLWHAVVNPSLASDLPGGHTIEMRLSAKLRSSLALSDWGSELDLARTPSSSTLTSLDQSSEHSAFQSQRLSWEQEQRSPYLHTATYRYRPPSPSESVDRFGLEDWRRVRFSSDVPPHGDRGDNDTLHLDPRATMSSLSLGGATGDYDSSLASLNLGPKPTIQPPPWGRRNGHSNPHPSTPALHLPDALLDLDPRATMSSLSLGGATSDYDPSLASLNLGPRPLIQPSPYSRDLGQRTATSHRPAPPRPLPGPQRNPARTERPDTPTSDGPSRRTSLDPSLRSSIDQEGSLFDDGLSQLGHRSEWGQSTVSGACLSRPTALRLDGYADDDAESDNVYVGRRLHLSALQVSDVDALGLRLRLGLDNLPDLRRASVQQAESALSLTHSALSGVSSDYQDVQTPREDLLADLAYSRPPSVHPATVAASTPEAQQEEQSKFARFGPADAVFLQICQRLPPPTSESGSSSTVHERQATPASSTHSSDTLVQPDDYTCSQCHCPLGGNEGIGLRYVCDMCGPRRHAARPQAQRRSSSVEAADGYEHSSSTFSDSTEAASSNAKVGYELCASCIGTHGAEHVAHTAPTGPSIQLGVPMLDRQRLHAFYELMWNQEQNAWVPIEEHADGSCAACSRNEWRAGHYRCSQCDGYHLCGGCFTAVDRLHAQHLFTRLPMPATPPQLTRLCAPSTSAARRGGRDPTDVVHGGVTCASCGQYPIVGARIHCLSCPGGRDFCAACDERGLSLQPRQPNPAHHSTQLPSHTQQHICLKLTMPIDRLNAQVAATALEEAAERLMYQALRGPLARPGHPHHPFHGNSTSFVARSPIEPDKPPPFGAQGTGSVPASGGLHAQLAAARISDEVPFAPHCDSCGSSFVGGVRYLCSRCPVEATGGFNLCENCEPFSLLVHNPTHVFLKINRSYSMSSLRQTPYIPPIYSTESIIPELDCPDAEQLWEKVLDTSGLSTIEVRRQLDPFVAVLPSNHPLREKLPRILTLRTQLLHARTTVGPRVIPDDLALTPGEESEAETETPARSQSHGSPRSRRSPRSILSMPPTPSPRDALQEVVHSLLHELNLVPISQLCHPHVLCDSCFDIISGAWHRCATCSFSIDLCSNCEMRADHDAGHVFAVFKQSVDPALFRSLVDLTPNEIGGQSSAGSCRPLLPHPLFE